MSKELELIRLLIKGANEYEKETGNKNPTVYLSRNNLLVIEKSLHRLESIENAEPSEALEAVKQIEFYVGTIIGLKFVKGDNVFSEAKKQDYEIFEKKCNIIKQALLKAQESKHYLKWEDLEFKEEEQKINILMSGNAYYLYVFREEYVEIRAIDGWLLSVLDGGYFEDKQFFNDLHLERVLE